jgi:hypothetical protein
VYSIPTRHGFNRIGKEAVFGVHRPDSGGTAPAIPFVEDTKQIDRHQIGNCMAHSSAFPAHHNVVLNGAKSNPATARNYYIDFQDGGGPSFAHPLNGSCRIKRSPRLDHRIENI